jgi:hypothetical protein
LAMQPAVKTRFACHFVGVHHLSPLWQTSFPHGARFGLDDGWDLDGDEPLRFGR